MTQAGIEFYEHHTEPAPLSAAPSAALPPPPQARPRTLRPYAAIALWLGAAALAVWAPFTRFYTVDAASQVGFDYHTDGWGRLRSSDEVPSGFHIERFGIALTTVAGLLLLLALAQLRPVARLAAVMRVTAIVIPALVTGLIVSCVLTLQVISDELRTANAAPAPPDMPDATAPPRMTLAVGPFLWIAAAAVGAAAAAVVLFVRHQRRQAVDVPASPVADMTDVDGIPDAESLD